MGIVVLTRGVALAKAAFAGEGLVDCRDARKAVVEDRDVLVVLACQRRSPFTNKAVLFCILQRLGVMPKPADLGVVGVVVVGGLGLLAGGAVAAAIKQKANETQPGALLLLAGLGHHGAKVGFGAGEIIVLPGQAGGPEAQVGLVVALGE